MEFHILEFLVWSRGGHFFGVYYHTKKIHVLQWGSPPTSLDLSETLAPAIGGSPYCDASGHCRLPFQLKVYRIDKLWSKSLLSDERQLESSIIWWKRKWLEQIQNIDTGIDVGPPSSKISRIFLTPLLGGCKNMRPLDSVYTWSPSAWWYASMIACSPFWNSGKWCTDLDSSNWWQSCCLHHFSLLEIDCSETDFLQKHFS